MVKDLQAEDNRLHRIVKKFSTEADAVSIARTSMYISVMFAIIAALAMNSANQANATAGTWQSKYSETERECRLAQLEIDDFKMTLVRNGLIVTHEGESP